MKRIVNEFCKLALFAWTAVSLPAQTTFTTLYSFSGSDGQNPFSALVEATDGDLYGTTNDGGPNNAGTVFKITPSGALATLYSFCGQTGCSDGKNPVGLVQARNGDLYGTAMSGGANGVGTVFKITLSGMFTTLYSFCGRNGCTDGYGPNAPLVEAVNGDLYGTTIFGPGPGAGTVFKITPKGTLTTIYNFCSKPNCTDGGSAHGGLIQARNGDLYGITVEGGANPGPGGYGAGTVFKITTSGTFTTLYNFCTQATCADGSYPQAGLVQAATGDLYGTTTDGGANGGGTVFKITPSGDLTTLFSFCGQSDCPLVADGEVPYAGLIQASNGDFYGATLYGGSNEGGTVFEIKPDGVLTALYSFENGFAAWQPLGDLGLRPPRKIPLVAELVTGGFAGEPPLNTGPIPVGFDVPGADAGLQ